MLWASVLLLLAQLASFQSTELRPDQDSPAETTGESSSRNHGMPVILGSSQVQVASDLNGLASLVPSAGGLSSALEIEVVASVGTNARQQLEVEALWPVAATNGSGPAMSSSANQTEPSARGGPQIGSLVKQNMPGVETWIFGSKIILPSSTCHADGGNQGETSDARASVGDCAEGQDSESDPDADESAAKE